MRRTTTWCVLGAFLGTLPGAPAAIAAPEGERVVHGEATFERDGASTTITTGTRETIVDYDRFDVGAQERVRIDQPSAGSRILNRVPRGDESRIDGALSSNGIVYILNPAGVFLGDRAVVDVGGLVAGAGVLSNEDFLAGVDRFTEVGGDVGIAAGAELRSAGDVALVGRRVENLGTIVSEGGLIAFVAGEDVLLARVDGHVAVRVDRPSEPPAAQQDFALTQAGSLEARQVTLAAGDTWSLAMNHTGVTRAGEIHVEAGGDALVQIAGTLDASNATPGERGGEIHVQGGRIEVADAVLDASGESGGGEIRVGGDLRGGGDMPTARSVTVGADATLRADATGTGDGGKIIVFADEHTRFYGSLSARGGAAGGDGGFAEISGSKLMENGQIDLGAPHGRSGTLLYDPDVVEIIGGSTEGTNQDVSYFTEESLETKDANIVIEATNRIQTSGSFGHLGDGEIAGGTGVVVIKAGNSLTMRTTGTSAGDLTTDELGIDLTGSAHGKDLTWRVSEGGDIRLETRLANAGDVKPGDPIPPKASILVGRLESESARFEPFKGASVDLPQDRNITISTQRGDIEIRGIAANGEDAKPAPDDDDPKTLGRSASAGAEIRITSQQGNIAVGDSAVVDDGIQARGGSGVPGNPVAGTPGAPSPGANGAEVVITAKNGNLTVQGDIDVAGGNGVGALSFENLSDPRNPLSFSGGGAGGAIELSAEGDGSDEGVVTVDGDLTATGGIGRPVLELAEGGGLEVAESSAGGVGGAIAMFAQKSITVGTPADRAKLDASGGDGSSSGGSARGAFPDLLGLPGENLTQAISFAGLRTGSQIGSSGSVTLYAQLQARGGDARSVDLETGIDADTAAGGRGGTGGDVQMQPGALLASQVRIDMSGGDGDIASVRGTPNPPRDESGNVPQRGGTGGTLTVFAPNGADLGGTGATPGDPDTCCGVISRGGNARNGAAGEGGFVSISAGDTIQTPGNQDLVVGDIDVTGGTASPEHTETQLALAGGAGGTVALAAVEQKVEKQPDGKEKRTNLGRVLLRGRVAGDGGTGFDGAATDAASTPNNERLPRARGALLDLSAVAAIEVHHDQSNPGNVLLSGGELSLEAPSIGTRTNAPDANQDGVPDLPEAPIPIAGTPVTGDEGKDIAILTADDRLAAELRSQTLEGVELVLRKETGSTDLTGESVLHATAANSVTGKLHTLERMQTGNGDPLLAYRLNVAPPVVDNVAGPQPELAIARGAVSLGTAGGQVANGAIPSSAASVATNRGAIVGVDGSGSGAHATSTGTLRLEGKTLGVRRPLPGETLGAAAPLEFDGATGAALRLDAQGTVQGSVVNHPFGAIEIVQRDASADADLALVGQGADGIEIDGGGSGAPTRSHIKKVDTTASRSGFAYRLETGTTDATLEVESLALGGTGSLLSTGDIELQDQGTAIRAGGHDLTLESSRGAIRQLGKAEDSISIDMGATPAAGEHSRELVLKALTSIGSTEAPIRTRNVEALAGRAIAGSLILANQGPADLRIERITPRNPVDLGKESALQPLVGLAAGGVSGAGDLHIRNRDSRIVLGKITDGEEFSAAHAAAQGKVTLEAPAIEIENARVREVEVPVVGSIFLRHNDAVLVAGGDVVLGGPVRTSAAAKVEPPQPGDQPDELVHGSLLIESGGTARFRGDVGGDGTNPDQPLALLDTTDAALELAPGEAEGTARQFFVGDAHFRGRLDGPAGALVLAKDLSSSEDDHVATALFEGDLGGRKALHGVVVAAEKIRFTGANRIVADDDGVHLATTRSSADAAIPPVASIADTDGGLAIRTSGSFSIGDDDDGDPMTADRFAGVRGKLAAGDSLRVHDKLSVQGPLAIEADSVTVSDLNAARQLSIGSPDIRVRARAGAPVERRDGSYALDANGDPIPDTGSDLVADSMAFSSVPTIVGADEDDVVRLGLGGGGVSAPGNLGAFEVRRFTSSVDTVTGSRMDGQDDQVLDLTATGRVIVGYPSEDMPHERAITEAALEPQFSDQGPGPAPAVNADQLMAYLRCGSAAGATPACDAADASSLDAVVAWGDSALATPRAEQLAASYREMRSRDLSAAFDSAGAGFRQAQGFGEFDGPAFASYLEQSSDHPEARAAIHQLAVLLVEVDLLGLAAQDETRVSHELASQLASEADLPGFDTDAALEAVAATPIGLPE